MSTTAIESAPDLVSYDAKKRTLRLGSDFRLSPTGLRVIGRPSLESFEQAGTFIATTSAAAKLWQGDWMRHGHEIHGEAFSQLLVSMGWGESLARQVEWVSSKVPPTSRRDDLDWTHHRAVASLPPEDQKVWLERAATGDGTGVAWKPRELAADDAIIAIRVPSHRLQSGIDLMREWHARIVIALVIDVPGEMGMPAICNIRHDLVLVGMRGTVVPSSDVPLHMSTAMANDHTVMQWLEAVFPCDPSDRDEVYLQ